MLQLFLLESLKELGNQKYIVLHKYYLNCVYIILLFSATDYYTRTSSIWKKNNGIVIVDLVIIYVIVIVDLVLAITSQVGTVLACSY